MDSACSSTRLKVAAAAGVVSLVGIGAVLVWWSGREPTSTVVLHEIEDPARLRDSTREVVAPAGDPDPASVVTVPATPEESRWYISPEEAGRIFGVPSKALEFDPWQYTIQPRTRNQRVQWPEHPDGHFTVVTNAEGMRDREPIEGQADLLVVVAGDSTTAGVCNQDETYANLLEADLAAAWPGSTVDVLNTATGGHGPHNYGGVLRKFHARRPHVFVMGLFGGNDLRGALLMHRFFQGDARVPLPREPRELRTRILRAHPDAAAHGWLTVATFRDDPKLARQALRATLRIVEEARDLCATSGTLLVVVLVPDPLRFEAVLRREDSRGAAQMAGIPLEEAAPLLDRSYDRLMKGLADLEVAAIDMRPVFDTLEDPPYWERDLHMDLVGHRLVARELRPVIEEWARERGLLDP